MPVELRVRGMVQGVGFRPTVWRIATDLQLSGEVLNDSEGVLIRLAGPDTIIAQFVRRLVDEAPMLARIDAIEQNVLRGPASYEGFRIAHSRAGVMATAIVPDAATCAECLAEVIDPSERRYRYPFTNCTHCGPRLTIIEAAPYDRASTTMRGFVMCAACQSEYADPADRRFHAQPIACPICGPRLILSTIKGCTMDLPPGSDAIAVTADLIKHGHIVALKGLGGFHLACDATNPQAVSELRRRKRRFGKAFAVMMPDLDTARQYCALTAAETDLLQSREAAILLLDTGGGDRLPEAIAPGLSSLGVMLPYTPLHHLLMRDLARPAVMTSGNMSDEPQCIDGTEARARLADIADFMLDHDRPIVNRVDDSVVRVMADGPAILRRARGFAPAPLLLPDGFKGAQPVLAMGGDLKATFCLAMTGQAVLSQHLGDLENAPTFDDYRRTLDLYRDLFAHRPRICAVDRHPDYLSRKLGEALAEADGLELVEVQHHHAHIAACLADNDVPIDTPLVLGIALDGTGFGEDGTIWGGEFLLADYRSCRRVGSLQPVAMPGGASAVREPWRNTLAHILAIMTWAEFESEFAGTALHRYLATKPVAALASMIRSATNAPLGSSCGRLFDAVAGALGIAADLQSHEGEAAARLEALVTADLLADTPDGAAYPFQLSPTDGMVRLVPASMWQAMLNDLAAQTPAAMISARFHKGLAAAVAGLASNILRAQGVQRTVALSGGSFQNRILLEEVKRRLEADGVKVLIHARVPTNDGGLAFGQAAVASARSLADAD
jgi:hydrogenase maturation protein HypF